MKNDFLQKLQSEAKEKIYLKTANGKSIVAFNEKVLAEVITHVYTTTLEAVEKGLPEKQNINEGSYEDGWIEHGHNFCLKDIKTHLNNLKKL